ncbi:MAG: ATP-dependent DNA ligase [Sandaracinaceae bacterium]
MKLGSLVATSDAVAKTRSRKKKQAALATLLCELAPDETSIGVSYLAGELPQGRIGLGWAAFRDLNAGLPSTEPQLELQDVHRTFDALAAISGSGSAQRRRDTLGALFTRATLAEREFLTQLVLGGLRQGALVGVMTAAVAEATEIDAAALRRAAMLAGSVPEVATAALLEGRSALARFELTLFRPVLPMLASPADNIDAAVERLGAAIFERKLDGARIQIHKRGQDVQAFSRRLHDVTARIPEVIEAVRAFDADELILDGEAIALRDDGAPHSFQTTMRRFGRTKDVAAMRASLPLSHLYFDLLFLDGASMLDAPAEARLRLLAQRTPPAHRIPHLITEDPAEAAAFFESALADGHEGLMAKRLDAPYEAGSRGFSWLKLKPVHTLDLVVLAVEWGSGRRKGWLSNLHLGARDSTDGSFVMLGKTFKGMTDEMLAWQTERLGQLEIGREGHVVHVRPELVVEVAFSDVMDSPQYPGGLALRFARLKHHRPDKAATDAATMAEIRAIHEHGHRRRRA